MHKFDVKELFTRLVALEYELLKCIYRTQGEEAARFNFYDAATALSVERNDIRRATKRLIDANILIADGENFQINPDVFKKDN